MTGPVAQGEERADPARPVLDLLDSLGIGWERYDHPAVFTVDEAVEQWKHIDAAHCKNLFLRNKKGNHHYLVVAGHTKEVDLRRLAEVVGDDRLSFGSPDRLGSPPSASSTTAHTASASS